MVKSSNMASLRKLAAVATSLVMAFALAMPSPALAALTTQQWQGTAGYDPDETYNNGVYIDTRAVPKDDNIAVSGSDDAPRISAKRNVGFQLLSSVDVTWSMTSVPNSSAIDPTGHPNPIEGTTIGIDPYSGFVTITTGAPAGAFDIVATAETNIKTPKTVHLSLNVREDTPAGASNIAFDPDAAASICEDNGLDLDAISFTADTMTTTGMIQRVDIAPAITYEPDYLVDDAIKLQSTTGHCEFTNGTELTTLQEMSSATTDTTINCIVGTNADSQKTQELKYRSKGKKLENKVVCTEMNSTNNSYTFQLDQIGHFKFETNENRTLPASKYTSLTWKVTRSIDTTNTTLAPLSDSDGHYKVFRIENPEQLSDTTGDGYDEIDEVSYDPETMELLDTSGYPISSIRDEGPDGDIDDDLADDPVGNGDDVAGGGDSLTLKINENPGAKNLYYIYEVRDASENKNKVAEILVSTASVSRDIIVRTPRTSASSATNITIQLLGELQDSGDNAGNIYNTLPVNLDFNPSTKRQAERAYLDFAAGGLEEDEDFSVKTETIEGEEQSVYYFEADEGNLDLAAATFPDNLGTRSFDASKIGTLTADGGKLGAFSAKNPYSVNYVFTNLSASTFGTEDAAANYNNTDLMSEEFSSTVLNDAKKLTKHGIGYKKVTVNLSRNGTQIASQSYIIRFVSPSTGLSFGGATTAEQSGLRISKDSNLWYSLLNNETIHILRGEAITPAFWAGDAIDGFKAQDNITVYDPYIEYSVANAIESEEQDAASVASTIIDSDGSYRVSGLESGVVVVTAMGAVRKSDRVSFMLYVNKDIFTGSFSINFNNAITDQTVARSGGYYAIQGKQNSVVPGITLLDAKAGIPVIEWSLAEGNDAIASIDKDTGKITTYQATNTPIEVRATVKGETTPKASEQITVADVPATGINALAEKVEADGSPVLKNVTDNKGTCTVGDEFTLYASEFLPVNATSLSGNTTWESSDPEKAVVEGGKVTALSDTGSGTVTITARYISGATSTATFDLTIEPAPVSVTGIEADDITFSRIGLSQAVNPTVLPEEALNKNVTYSSSNDEIATVDSTSGMVTAVGTGVCQVTITSAANPEVTRTINVKVSAPVTAVTLLPSELSLSAGEQGKLTAALVPDDAIGDIELISSNPDIAAVASDGTVTAVAAGSATITAKCGESTATSTVIVAGPAITVTSIEAADITLKRIGESQTVTPTVLPVDATDKRATFASDNDKIATVDANTGTVTAVGVGECHITITSVSNSNVKKVVAVKVSEPITISLSNATLSLAKGEQGKLTATLAPEGARGNIVFESSNTAVATVATDGTVTAIAEGTTTITAKCDDSTATCVVTVVTPIVPAESISVNNLSLTLGDNALLNYGVSPATATDKSVTFLSSNEKVATVDASGIVKATGVGTCDIYVLLNSDPTIRGIGKVTVASIAGVPQVNPPVQTVVNPKAQFISVKVANKTFKVSQLKKKARSFKIGASARTAISYKPANAKSKKALKVTSKGKVTVKKGTKKGTYKITVKAAATSSYRAVSRTVKIIVKK